MLSLLPLQQLPLVSDNLHQLLVGMIEDSSEQRSSLALIASLSQQCSGQAEMEHVDRLVTYVLGNSHEVSSAAVGSALQLLSFAACCGSTSAEWSVHNVLCLLQLSSDDCGDVDDADLESQVRCCHFLSLPVITCHYLSLPVSALSHIILHCS